MEKNRYYQVKSIEDNTYVLTGANGEVVTLPVNEVDNNAKVFNIKDAKDGDVLVTDFEEDNMIVMYHSMCTKDTINVHCCLDNKIICSNLGIFDAEDVKPATKEQRDLLFQKLKEAGYKWDADKKELKKIEQKHWSEKDEAGFGDAMWAIERARTIAKDENDMGNLWYAEHWLKSFKDRYTWKPSEENNVDKS